MTGQRQLQDETRNIYVLGFGAAYVNGSSMFGSVQQVVLYTFHHMVRQNYTAHFRSSCFMG